MQVATELQCASQAIFLKLTLWWPTISICDATDFITMQCTASNKTNRHRASAFRFNEKHIDSTQFMLIDVLHSIRKFDKMYVCN